MVTLGTLIVFALMFGLTTLIDIYLYKETFLNSSIAMLSFYPGTREWMTWSGVIAGFIYSVITDFRLRKKKKKNKQAAR